MIRLAISSVLLACASIANAASFNCFTNYAPTTPYGKIRVAGEIVDGSLNSFELRYFNGREFALAETAIQSNGNPDPNYKPRTYKDYARYFLTGSLRGQSYEILLPNKLTSQFKAYLTESDFEDRSPKVELLCRSTT